MTNAGVEAIFDLRDSASGESLDPCVQISEKALAMMRSSDETIFLTVQHECFTGPLV
jgi:hypothetical protein